MSLPEKQGLRLFFKNISRTFQCKPPPTVPPVYGETATDLPFLSLGESEKDRNLINGPLTVRLLMFSNQGLSTLIMNVPSKMSIYLRIVMSEILNDRPSSE